MGRAALAVAVVAVSAVACSGRSAGTASTGSAGAAASTGTTQGEGAPVGQAVRVPDDTRQLVVATTAGWDETAATMGLWRRDQAGGPWTRVGPPWPAVIGRSGLAWGRGVHGDGPPAGRSGPRKHEGDGKSPAGLFAIGRVFGYDAAPPRGARLPYTTATDTWRCVDDPASRHYNRLVDEAEVAPDWTSREELRRADELYRWVVEVRHNPDGAPGEGSCIFLHVWSGAGSSTAGCTAMDEPVLAGLIGALEPADRPMFVLLPEGEHRALAGPWGLPPGP